MHARIVHDLGMRIVAGEFRPGDRLPGEAALLTDYDVSRPVLREAMRVLVAKGLVLSRQRAGAIVRPRNEWHLLDPDVLYWLIQTMPQAEFVETLLTVRRVFEPAAAALAARVASDDSLRGIAEAYAGMEAATTPEQLLEPDLAFHRRIAEATNNDLLAYIGNMLSLALRESIKLSQQAPQHPRAVAAAAQGDPDRAAAPRPAGGAPGLAAAAEGNPRGHHRDPRGRGRSRPALTLFTQWVQTAPGDAKRRRGSLPMIAVAATGEARFDVHGPAGAQAPVHLHRDGDADRAGHAVRAAAAWRPTSFPEIDIPVISIIWNYNGLSAQEMGQRIAGQSERSLTTTVSDIEHIESTSLAGITIIKVFFQPTANIQTAIAQVVAIDADAGAPAAAGHHAAADHQVLGLEHPGGAARPVEPDAARADGVRRRDQRAAAAARSRSPASRSRSPTAARTA